MLSLDLYVPESLANFITDIRPLDFSFNQELMFWKEAQMSGAVDRIAGAAGEGSEARGFLTCWSLAWTGIRHLFMMKKPFFKGSRAIRDRIDNREHFFCRQLHRPVRWELTPSRQPCSIWCQALELPSWTLGDVGGNLDETLQSRDRSN